MSKPYQDFGRFVDEFEERSRRELERERVRSKWPPEKPKPKAEEER